MIPAAAGQAAANGVNNAAMAGADELSTEEAALAAVIAAAITAIANDASAAEAGSDTDYLESKLACSDDVSIAAARDFSRRGG